MGVEYLFNRLDMLVAKRPSIVQTCVRREARKRRRDSLHVCLQYYQIGQVGACEATSLGEVKQLMQRPRHLPLRSVSFQVHMVA